VTPSANVEIVRILIDTWRSGDPDRAYDFFDPDIEWDASRFGDVVPDLAGVYHGHDGVRAFWRRWLSAWRDLEFEVEDVLDVGDEEVLLLIRDQRQWGRHTGIVTESPSYAQVYTFRDGKVVRYRQYPSWEEARRDVGLAPEAESP
jgi:ketosteroid isomerase-like protein